MSYHEYTTAEPSLIEFAQRKELRKVNVHNDVTPMSHRTMMHIKKNLQLCKDYTETGVCPRGPSCTFAHGLKELQGFDVWKTQICQQWMKGVCKYGSMCRFAHGRQELRSTEQSHLVKTLKFLLAENKILRGANERLSRNVSEANMIQEVRRGTENNFQNVSRRAMPKYFNDSYGYYGHDVGRYVDYRDVRSQATTQRQRQSQISETTEPKNQE